MKLPVWPPGFGGQTFKVIVQFRATKSDLAKACKLQSMRVSCLRVLFLVLLTNVQARAFCQQNSNHPSILGAGFSVYQFTGNTKKTVPGIGVQYLSSLNHFLDWSIRLDGTFTNEIEKTFLANKKSLLKSELLLRARAIPKQIWIQPFLSTGIEGLNYNSKSYLFVPVDIGLGFNYKNIYVSINTGYHQSLSQNLYSFYQSTLCISGLVGFVKKKNQVVKNIVVKSSSLDTDGDGIIDSEDSCRYVPGLAKFNGCPDTDGDGIEDKKDQCPLVFGIAKYQGCPVPDTDKDGINDEEDSCITQPGVLHYHGCPVPDTDGDGINDEEDSCINISGLKSNHGCPVIKKELTEEMQKAAKNIFFKSGSYQLLPASYVALNKVVSILKENLGLKLLIEGHTDDRGTEQSNQLLSENRANAVLDYLKVKGINEARLKSAAYGQTKPVDTNATAEGRSKNRRVELKLYY